MHLYESSLQGSSFLRSGHASAKSLTELLKSHLQLQPQSAGAGHMGALVKLLKMCLVQSGTLNPGHPLEMGTPAGAKSRRACTGVRRCATGMPPRTQKKRKTRLQTFR